MHIGAILFDVVLWASVITCASAVFTNSLHGGLTAVPIRAEDED